VAVTADLVPQTGGAVRGTDTPVVTTAPDGSVVALSLNFEPLAARSTLEIEMEKVGGGFLWKTQTERDRGTEDLMAWLPSGFPPGDYVIRLSNVTRGQRLLATYQLILRHSTPVGR
jgi:hypothetical protein